MSDDRTSNDSELQPRTRALLNALDRAWGAGDVSALDSVLAANFMRSGRKHHQDREQIKASILDMRRAFPDLEMTVLRVVESADEVAVHWNSTGTLSDEYLGLPATGRQYSVTGATFSRFEGDLVVSETVVYDRRGQYSSLGVPLSGARSDEEVGVAPTIGVDVLRSMHRKVVTGVTVVAVNAEGEPRGLAVNAFSSVSFDPPLVLVCVQKTSSTYSRLLSSPFFSVNVLAADQVAVARVFATKQDRKFDLVPWHTGEYGTPLIDGASAAMEVELQDTLHAQTHTIFIGRVRAVAIAETPALIYTDGAFFDGRQLAEAVEANA
ncbi:MAG: Oxidoreductase [Subtercola sp.]|nr:Oxidoreductase [Subtercola sp.]